MATRVIDDSKLNDIAVAIQAKDSGGQMTVDEMPDRIGALPEFVDEDAALVLIDWEGTLLRSYTYNEVMELTELPNPSDLPNYAYADHEWLVFQEWNWSLAGIKSYCQKYPYMNLYVAAIYNPSDGQDHYEYYDSRVRVEKQAKTIKLARNVIAGDTIRNGKVLSISLPGILQINNQGLIVNRCLSFIAYPRNVAGYIGVNGGTRIISLPESVRTTAMSFQQCNVLKVINLPDGITSITQEQFRDTYCLKKIKCRNSLTRIGYAAFNASGLLYAWIPQNVVILDSQCFAYSGLHDIVIEGLPSISYSNLFVGCGSYLKIYVPQANLSWFSTETNWADIYAQFTFVTIEDNIEYLESLGFNVDEYKEVS